MKVKATSQQAFNTGDVDCDGRSEVADRCQAFPDLAVTSDFQRAIFFSLEETANLFKFAVQKCRELLKATMR